jgi:2-oxoacid:acceptor oxidoreductase gamma subunit (pyruvate/2-ketoisovalerate family)
MLEIIFYGRGGQGAVTGSQILATAAILGGNYKDCSAFPSFGAERRGAPVEAYCRISDSKIWARSQIYAADMAVVLDETVFGQQIIDILKPECFLIMNTIKTPQEIFENYNFSNHTGIIATCDLIKICYDIGLLVDSQPVLNTPILGSIMKIEDKITLDDLTQAIKIHFGESSRTDKNITAAITAAETTCIYKF